MTALAAAELDQGRTRRGSLPFTAAMTAASSTGAELPSVFTSAATACPAAWSIAIDAENPPVPPLWKSSPSMMIQASPPAGTRGCWHSLIAVPSGPGGRRQAGGHVAGQVADGRFHGARAR